MAGGFAIQVVVGLGSSWRALQFVWPRLYGAAVCPCVRPLGNTWYVMLEDYISHVIMLSHSFQYMSNEFNYNIYLQYDKILFEEKYDNLTLVFSINVLLHVLGVKVIKC